MLLSQQQGRAHKGKAAQAAWSPDEEEALLAFLSRRQATASQSLQWLSFKDNCFWLEASEAVSRQTYRSSKYGVIFLHCSY